jgi:acyl-coenzyme A synthetase/AMP-(fatty) acid ligase
VDFELTDEQRLLQEDFRVPRSVFVHAELPRTSNGKIDRRALAENPRTVVSGDRM